MSATEELWARLDRPFDPIGALEAFSGMLPADAHHLVDLRFITSAEVDAMLDRMHETLRALSIATTSSPTRSVGEVRGPVLWSETIAARSASPGAHDVFICASPVKAYDTEENRVLVHALLRIRDAARTADPAAHPTGPEADLRRARHNGTRAIRALEHRTLASVTKSRPDGRALHKARSGAKARSYRTAVAVLARAKEPLLAGEVRDYCDAHTRRQHGIVLALLDRLRNMGRTDVAHVRVENGTLRAGPLRYVQRHRADEEGAYGVLLGNLLLDAPTATRHVDPVDEEIALFERAGGRPSLVVQSSTDIERAIRLAVF
jgi:hypothetical protein